LRQQTPGLKPFLRAWRSPRRLKAPLPGPFEAQGKLEVRGFHNRRDLERSLCSLAGLKPGHYKGTKTKRKPVLEFSRNTFVDENFHPSWRTSDDLTNSRAAIAASRVTVGKSFRKLLQIVSAFQIVEERLERNPRASEHRSTSKDLWIFNDDGVAWQHE